MPVRSYQTLPRHRGGLGVALAGLAGLALVALVWLAGPQFGIFLPGTGTSRDWQADSSGAGSVPRSRPAPGEIPAAAPAATGPAGRSPVAEPDPAQVKLLQHLLQIGRFIDTTTALLLATETPPGAPPDAAADARREALLANRAMALAEHERLRQQLLALLPGSSAVSRDGEAPLLPQEPGAASPPFAGPALILPAPEPDAVPGATAPALAPPPAPAPQNRLASNSAPRLAPGGAPRGAAEPASRAPARGGAANPGASNGQSGSGQSGNGPQCRTILLRAQLGEELSSEDHGILRRGCRASR